MCLVSLTIPRWELDIQRILSDIANYIYEHPKALDLNLQGIWIADRESSITSKISAENSDFFLLPASLSWDVVQEQIPAVEFVHKYEHVFAFKSVLSSTSGKTN
jgi:hypothetical protein